MKIFGNKKDASNIRELVEDCARRLGVDIPEMVLFAEDAGAEFLASVGAEGVVLNGADRRLLPEGTKAISYSVGVSSADVCALNLQHREQSSSFEILHDSFMGRVFFKPSCKYTQEQILIAVSALMLMGAENDKILREINELIT